MPEEIEEIRVPPQTLDWSTWFPWKRLELHGSSEEGINVPPSPGIYEVKRTDQTQERLHIGQTTNLRSRIMQQLLRGVSHSTSYRIHHAFEEGTEKKELLLVRWAETEYPCCVEEVLKKRYLERFGDSPEYSRR